MVCLCKFILVCNLQPPNLRNKLIIRKLPSDYYVTNNGSKPCNKKCSKLCNQINPSKSVRRSKGIFNISGSYSCTSSNVCVPYPVQKI
ncbi:unnamed protein product [Staurois parvus]|uniref:Uncharacterized protein n=1 Tax=Staurois parvus TaxID=386267 RepID=A0ABN9DTR6_9NEOB|nr:unnamed protein product [Staurois parvus]